MVEWAKLTPAERGQARLRFEEARQLPAPDRSARWRAYQALPPEQRQQLAARAAAAASDAARRRGIEAGQGTARDSKEAKSTSSRTRRWLAAAASGRADGGPGRARCDDDADHAPPDAAGRISRSGMPKIATTPEFVNRSTSLPQRGPQGAAAVGAAAGDRAAATSPRRAPSR